MEKPIIRLPQKRYIVIIDFRKAFISAGLARLSSFPKHFSAGNVQVNREKRSIKGLPAWSLLTGFLIGLLWNALIISSFMSRVVRKNKCPFCKWIAEIRTSKFVMREGCGDRMWVTLTYLFKDWAGANRLIIVVINYFSYLLVFSLQCNEVLYIVLTGIWGNVQRLIWQFSKDWQNGSYSLLCSCL